VHERTKDWREFYVPAPDDFYRAQGARCMDCGVPFCQGDTGCPVQNVIP
jgi:glutamate synthase (NADPH/NADH) small chain